MDELPYDKQLEVKLYIQQNRIPFAIAIVHNELNCGLRKAKEIVDTYRN